ncbi:hypothetical protein Emed_000344 [Eimeria media]
MDGGPLAGSEASKVTLREAPPCAAFLSLAAPVLPASVHRAFERRCCSVRPTPPAAAAAAKPETAAAETAAAAAARGDCLQCRILGFCLLSGASSAAGIQAWRAAARSGDRRFFAALSALFAGQKQQQPAAAAAAAASTSMNAEDLGGGAPASFPLLKPAETPQPSSAHQSRQQQQQQQQRQQQESEVQEVYSDMGGRGVLGAPMGSSASRGPPSGPAGVPGSGGAPLGEALEDLLREMNLKFSALGSSILGRLDAMASKLDGLEQQLTSLLAEEEGGAALGGPLTGSALLGGPQKTASEGS